MRIRPRLLAIMGSGETSPTMVKTHRMLLDRIDAGPAVLLDTPFGFQENADDIAARAVEYFRASVGHDVAVASFRRADAEALGREAALEQLRVAGYVFAGPGSPSYALRQWRPSPVPGLLADKLRVGGCVCFASAAALTLGVATVPVYEVYKVGEEPAWLEGLDLLAVAGLNAAVIPHFDNAEGGNHDTRYCYLGERRLRMLEEQLPEDAFVLGVDEHTACILDLDAGTLEVTGRGAVTIRRGGAATRLDAGTTTPLTDIADVAAHASELAPAAPSRASPAPRDSPLLQRAGHLGAEFDTAATAEDVAAAVRALLALDDELASWSADTLQSDEPDQVRALVRAMLARLADLGERLERRASLAPPLVDLLLEVRASARDDGRFADADTLRARLAALGVEVMDEKSGTGWRLTS